MRRQKASGFAPQPGLRRDKSGFVPSRLLEVGAELRRDKQRDKV